MRASKYHPSADQRSSLTMSLGAAASIKNSTKASRIPDPARFQAQPPLPLLRIPMSEGHAPAPTSTRKNPSRQMDGGEGLLMRLRLEWRQASRQADHLSLSPSFPFSMVNGGIDKNKAAALTGVAFRMSHCRVKETTHQTKMSQVRPSIWLLLRFCISSAAS